MPFTKLHDTPEIILKKSDETDCRQYMDIWVKCKKKQQSRVQEYLKGIAIDELPDGYILMKLTLVENEQLWIGTLEKLIGHDKKIYTDYYVLQE